MAQTTATPPANQQAVDRTAIRPFAKVNFPEADLTELRTRINATRWPEKETVTDVTQGVQLATIQALAQYWGAEYDWRKIEAKLNALPQFITEIDGLDIHFIHVRSKHENALPLIVTHGWPGSATPEEKAAAAEGTFAYCGRYEIDIKQERIVHLPEVATDPGYVGSRQIRPYRFEGNRLILSDVEKDNPSVARWKIVWEKVQ